MTTGDWIELGVLILGFLGLMLQQQRQLNESYRADKRIETKLRILFLCQDRALTKEEILRHFRDMNPTSSIDEAEINKSIYEMLVDETLRYRTNNTFKARRNTATPQESDTT